MKRGILLVVVVALASCKGGGAKKRVPGGEPASAARLIKTIEAVSGEESGDGLRWLAEGVSEECGKGCECLKAYASEEAGNNVAALYSCPSVCNADARAKTANAEPGKRIAALAGACKPEGIGLTASTVTKVGDDWIAAFVAGQYLADAYDGANADDKKAYDKALADFTVAIAPTEGAAGVDVVAAKNADHLGRGRVYIAVDAKGAITVGRTPAARFTHAGAELVLAPPKALPDAKELALYMRAMAAGALDKLGNLDEAALAEVETDNDDPPPPPPEDEEEEDDESGGTGTAMALEEGKMGKKDSDRAEGQYKMKRNDDIDPQLARQQAIEQARVAGVLGSSALTQGGAFASLTGTGDLKAGFDEADIYGGLLGNAGPDASVVGLASTPIRDQVIVIADGAAPARKVVEVMMALPDSAVLAVDHDGVLAALPVVFGDDGALMRSNIPTDNGDAVDLVVDVGAAKTQILLTRVNETREVAAGELEKAIKATLEDAIFADRRDVVVSVRDDAKVAHMIPAIDDALSAGARMVRLETWYERSAPTGFGPIGFDSGTSVGQPVNGSVPTVRMGQPNSVGDLDKAIIRRYIKRNIAKIAYCYEKTLLAKPGIEGTVNTQFFITPKGDVAAANATGVDPEVATCVAGVIKAIEFPKPKGGGGVQVNYPFTFRPTGG
jgi:hypothetical protein